MKNSSLVLSILVILVGTFLFACSGDDGGGGRPSTSEDSLIVKYTVANLPDTLPVNQPLTNDSWEEHYWLVEFDINKNDVMDGGDVSIYLGNLKEPGSSPMDKRVVDLDVFLNEYVSEVVSINTQLTGVVSVSGSTITLTIPKSEGDTLVNVSKDAHVHFATLGTPPSGSSFASYDNYPLDGAVTYTTIPTDGKFTDGDDSFDMEVRHVDLLTMEIVF